jgi:hypothetical protein
MQSKWVVAARSAEIAKLDRKAPPPLHLQMQLRSLEKVYLP